MTVETNLVILPDLTSLMASESSYFFCGSTLDLAARIALPFLKSWRLLAGRGPTISTASAGAVAAESAVTGAESEGATVISGEYLDLISSRPLSKIPWIAVISPSVMLTNCSGLTRAKRSASATFGVKSVYSSSQIVMDFCFLGATVVESFLFPI